MKKSFFLLVALCLLLGLQCKQSDQPIPAESPTIKNLDPLPSWNEGAVKQSIVTFIGKVTKEGSAEFLQPADRIAVFDNDGTLWSEQPVYFQAAFIFDRVKALAPQHPEWKKN